MAAPVQTSPVLEIGAPQRLYDVPDRIPESAGFDFVAATSRDGSRAAFAVPPRIPPPALQELRVLDRAGNIIAMPGEPGRFFNRPIISPDGTKVLAGRMDPEANLFELWAYDLEAETSVRLVSDPDLNSWIWSEDGNEIVYVSMDFNDDAGGGIFRLAADGSGSPELLYRHYPGTGFNLIDWSADGRFVLFNSGGVLNVLDLEGDGEAVELIRDEFSVGQGLLSPDNRFVAFSSDETDANDVWLWSFDPDAVALGPVSDKLRLSTEGSTGPLSWGRNGREVTFRNNGAINSVEISTDGGVNARSPLVLFPQPEGAGNASASRNGERWVFHAPAVGER